MKKCPFCAEDIQDEAIKCKHCGEFLSSFERLGTEQHAVSSPDLLKEKWYLKPSAVVAAFLCVGPLAIPLVLINKKYSKKQKILITSVMVLISVILSFFFYKIAKASILQFKEINAMLSY